MIINITIDTDNYSVWATDENQETSIDYSACELSAISIEEIINDYIEQ